MTEEYNESIKELIKYEKMIVNPWRNLVRGIFYGFGFFIGSAILAAALIYILSNLGIDGDNFFSRAIKGIVEAADKYR